MKEYNQADHLVTQLCSMLQDKGAWFNSDLVISVDNCEISVISASARPDRRSFIRIPLSLMPLLWDFEFWVDGDSLQCSQAHSNVDLLHLELMDRMTAVYNACNKLEQWAEKSPLLALDNVPQVRDKLMQAKINAPKLKKYKSLLEFGDRDTLLVESFLGSRTFNIQVNILKELGYEDENAEQSQPVIMPVIDYFNHRFQAEAYSVQTTPPPPSMRVYGVPDSNTHEVFVRYNLYDPVDTFLFYGFVDTNSPWLASIPLSLMLPDGRSLEVLNTGGTVKKQLPPALRDLRLYMPMIQGQDEWIIRLNKLLIPGKNAPRAMQRVLASVLKSLYSSLNHSELLDWVQKLESDVLEINRKWWNELSSMAESLPEDKPITRSVNDLCTWSRQHIETYIASKPALK